MVSASGGKTARSGLGLAAALGIAFGWVLSKAHTHWLKPWLAAQGRALVVSGAPLVTLDLETTGLRVSADRIIEIAAVKLLPNGKLVVKGAQRVDPRMPISPEATRVTGITDADVAGVAPRWEEVAEEWRDFLEGAVLHGYNAKRFDVPLLRAEFDRAGIYGFPPVGCPVVDSCRIFFAQEKRTLAAAVATYCGRTLKDSHSALADSVAALDVLSAQVARYPDLPRTPEGLAAWCSAPTRDGDATWDGRFRWSGDSLVFAFGKLQGCPLSAVAVEERDYLLWMKEQDFSDEALVLVNDALAGTNHTRESLAARFGHGYSLQ